MAQAFAIMGIEKTSLMGGCSTLAGGCARLAEENDAVKMRTLYPFVLACLMFAIAWWLFAEYVLWFGFWDRYASELGTAEHILAKYFIWFSIATGIWLLGLGWRSFRADVGKPLLYTCVLFLFAAVIAVSLDLYFRTYMMDSAGG
jgi:hypothetical protein